MLNMAVARPMPRPRTRTAAKVWSGLRKSCRKPNRTSCPNEAMEFPSRVSLRWRGGEGYRVALLRRRRFLRLFEPAPGLLALIEDRQRGHAAAGGVDVPPPEQRPFEIGAVGLQHAEDQAVHAVEDAELEDVGAEEAPDGTTEDLDGTGLPALFPVLRRAPEAVLLDPPHVLVQRIRHVVLHGVAQQGSRTAGDHVGVYPAIGITGRAGPDQPHHLVVLP